MTENVAAALDPSDVFEDMVLSTAFEPRSASIEEKRLIFGKVWAEDIPRLRCSFDSAGMDHGNESYGFGYLVEVFARHSKKLPIRNTEKGEKAARTILAELHSGRKGNVDLGHCQSNSDLLGVKLTSRLITITGIGEVKSSYKAALRKVGGQLKRQERSISFLAEQLKSAQADKLVRGFFEKRGIVVSDDLKRFLIVPFGQGEEARRDEKFSDWEIVEIEFGYDELVFIAQQIWPDFKSDSKIGPGKLTSLFQIAGKLGDWIKPRLDTVFSDSKEFGSHNPLPCFELGLFFLATGKTPMLEDEVKWSAELIQKSFWPAVQKCLNFFVDSTPCPEADFSERDKLILKKFWYLLTSNKEDLERFIYFLRSLNVKIKDLTRDQNQLEQLKNMSKVWTI